MQHSCSAYTTPAQAIDDAVLYVQLVPDRTSRFVAPLDFQRHTFLETGLRLPNHTRIVKAFLAGNPLGAMKTFSCLPRAPGLLSS